MSFDVCESCKTATATGWFVDTAGLMHHVCSACFDQRLRECVPIGSTNARPEIVVDAYFESDAVVEAMQERAEVLEPWITMAAVALESAFESRDVIESLLVAFPELSKGHSTEQQQAVLRRAKALVGA